MHRLSYDQCCAWSYILNDWLCSVFWHKFICTVVVPMPLTAISNNRRAYQTWEHSKMKKAAMNASSKRSIARSPRYEVSTSKRRSHFISPSCADELAKKGAQNKKSTFILRYWASSHLRTILYATSGVKFNSLQDEMTVVKWWWLSVHSGVAMETK